MLPLFLNHITPNELINFEIPNYSREPLKYILACLSSVNRPLSIRAIALSTKLVINAVLHEKKPVP